MDELPQMSELYQLYDMSSEPLALSLILHDISLEYMAHRPEATSRYLTSITNLLGGKFQVPPGRIFLGQLRTHLPTSLILTFVVAPAAGIKNLNRFSSIWKETFDKWMEIHAEAALEGPPFEYRNMRISPDRELRLAIDEELPQTASMSFWAKEYKTTRILSPTDMQLKIDNPIASSLLDDFDYEKVGVQLASLRNNISKKLDLTPNEVFFTGLRKGSLLLSFASGSDERDLDNNELEEKWSALVESGRLDIPGADKSYPPRYNRITQSSNFEAVKSKLEVRETQIQASKANIASIVVGMVTALLLLAFIIMIMVPLCFRARRRRAQAKYCKPMRTSNQKIPMRNDEGTEVSYTT